MFKITKAQKNGSNFEFNLSKMDQNPVLAIDHTRINEDVSKIKAEYLEQFQKLTENIT